MVHIYCTYCYTGTCTVPGTSTIAIVHHTYIHTYIHDTHVYNKSKPTKTKTQAKTMKAIFGIVLYRVPHTCTLLYWVPYYIHTYVHELK